MNFRFNSILTLLLISNFTFGQQILDISSPNKEITVRISQVNQLTYEVNHLGNPIVTPSSIGFKLSRPEISLTEFEVIDSKKVSVNETWQPVFGEKSVVKNHYNELTVALQSNTQPSYFLNVIFRVFDDGLGFRYEFPDQPNMKHFVVAEEQTEFSVTGDHKVFWIPGDYETNEYLYNTTKLSEIDALAASEKEKDIALKRPIGRNFIQTPLMLVTESGYYISIHEAALVNYPVMNLELDRNNFKFTSHLVPDGIGNKAYLQTGFKTPWRTLIFSKEPEKILESNLIVNLNEPSKIEDPSWLTAQKFIGVWWEMHVGKGTWEYTGGKHAANTENVKKYIDFAAKYGINGVLVEGWNEGWEDWFGNWKEEVFDFVSPYPDYDTKYLTEYAASKNVKIIMHHETSGSVTNYERRLNDAFDYMNSHGINTVKTGYVGKIIPRGEHHDSQWMTNHYLRVAQKAVEKKIMVVSHESSRPTGLHRTYPNWMASEAARGNEFNNAPTLGITPEHETILAFTRILGGPMDYTPGFFHFKLNQFEPARTTQINTTISKQVAMFVVFYSPIQMLGDLPENLDKHPELVKYIVDIPLEWETTKVLNAEPGDYLVYARKAKKDDIWYLAGISDENARSFELDFSFLDADKKYNMEIIQDTERSHFTHNPTAYQILQKKAHAKTKLKMNLAPGGGFIIKISPEVK